MKHDDARKYDFKYTYDLIDDYTFPTNKEDWLDCPVCGAKPKTWLFDNGRSTGCKCHNNKYSHFSINAECIMSCQENDGHTRNYDEDSLRLNWNHWVKTGEIIFPHASLRTDGRY